jgi:hypothetical protein
MIYIIAGIVCALAVAIYFIRLICDGQKEKRRVEEFQQDIAMQERTLSEDHEAWKRGEPPVRIETDIDVDSHAYRKAHEEPVEACFIIDPKPFKLWKSGVFTFGEAINETRKRAGYPPLAFKHGEDRAFWPLMTMPDPVDDSDTKIYPGPEQPV